MLQGYSAIIIAMLIWGSIGIFVRMAGQDPLITVTYRVIFASVALVVLHLVQPKPQAAVPTGRIGWRRRLLLAFSGVALAINWLFFFKAVATTSVSNAVLSYYTAPVLVALTSPLLLGERLEGRTVVATAVSFGGIILMLYQPGTSLSAADMLGIGYGLIAAFFYAMVTITGRWLADIPASRLVLIQSLISTAILIPAVLMTSGASALAVPLCPLGILVLIGVVHTAFVLFLYYQGLRRVKVQHVGVLAYLDPVSAVLFAYLFLHEVPTAATLEGGALVLLGSALLLLKRRP